MDIFYHLGGDFWKLPVQFIKAGWALAKSIDVSGSQDSQEVHTFNQQRLRLGNWDLEVNGKVDTNKSKYIIIMLWSMFWVILR